MAATISKLKWYWHRLHAMSPGEVMLRVEKKRFQRADRNFVSPQNLALASGRPFPALPSKSAAPRELLDGLSKDVREIMEGRWKAFGHLPLDVGIPPRWQADNLVGKDLQSSAVAFDLDHRAQPDGADIKVIWEPSRWYQLVRLAMAAWLLDDSKAQERCVEWLHDWATRNPPFTGLNWTSGLETGIRLIQYAWIDAFLEAAGVPHKSLAELRGRILPPHVWYTWRYKSFGSSANNHLIGELAGLIVAQARWPELAKISAPLAQIGALLEREILAQFAEDGGNNEQALGYHLFSWEFCFQAERALSAAGEPLSTRACDRLKEAARFYALAKPEGDPWDFGDSDNAWVTPLFADEKQAAREWWCWFRDAEKSPGLKYWWGSAAKLRWGTQGEWTIFPQSGYAVFENTEWFLRLDFSPLGYLSMAPHGHLDALHLSVWHRGRPVIVDPGTGAYYADKTLRAYLADWAAHNGPHLKHLPKDFPKRFGTFLWSDHHSIPSFQRVTPQSIRAEIVLPYGRAVRTVTFLPERNAFKLEDQFVQQGTGSPVVTRWKFSPELKIERASGHDFRVGPVRLETGAAWKMARTYNPPDELRGRVAASTADFRNLPLECFVSPAFRAVTPAAYLVLESTESGPLEVVLSAG